MAAAGLFTEVVDIYKVVQSTNEYGEQADSYVLKYTTRARVQNNSGGRVADSEEIYFSYTKIFTLRVYVDIEDFDRIKYDGKFYRILNIDKSEKLQQITVTAEQVKE